MGEKIAVIQSVSFENLLDVRDGKWISVASDGKRQLKINDGTQVLWAVMGDASFGLECLAGILSSLMAKVVWVGLHLLALRIGDCD